MKEITKKGLIALGKVIFHAGIPIIFVIAFLNIWATGISNDADMEWNIFITISCFGAAILIILVSFFCHYIVDKYFWSVLDKLKQEGSP